MDFIRKLTRVGQRSICVVIPAEFVSELGWRERQKVVVKLNGKKVIIEDWKSTKKKK